MSFPVMTKEILVSALKEKGVTASFFDLYAIDAVSSCHYHTIKDDVRNALYSFEHFISACVQMEREGSLRTVHDARTLASWLYSMEVSGHDVTEMLENRIGGGWQNGVMN